MSTDPQARSVLPATRSSFRTVFGVWQQYRYECLYNYRSGRVVNVTLNPEERHDEVDLVKLYAPPLDSRRPRPLRRRSNLLLVKV